MSRKGKKSTNRGAISSSSFLKKMKYIVKEFDMYHECVMWFERFDISNKEIRLTSRHGKGKNNIEPALKLSLVLGGDDNAKGANRSPL